MSSSMGGPSTSDVKYLSSPLPSSLAGVAVSPSR